MEEFSRYQVSDAYILEELKRDYQSSDVRGRIRLLKKLRFPPYEIARMAVEDPHVEVRQWIARQGKLDFREQEAGQNAEASERNFVERLRGDPDPYVRACLHENPNVIGLVSFALDWEEYFFNANHLQRLALVRNPNINGPLVEKVFDPDDKDLRITINERAELARAYLSTKKIVLAEPEITFHDDAAAACRDAEMVQESAPERLELKHDLFATMETALAPDAVIASSTSYFPPSEMQAAMRHPGRLALGHPFNPPHLVPLVEVLGGANTDPAVVDWLMDFYTAMGRYPIRLHKEIPGHLVNRLQIALWDEAARLVGEGVADAADVDAALVHGPGLRWAVMGPYLTMELANAGGMAGAMAHFGPVAEHYAGRQGQATLRHDPRVTELIAEGIAKRAAGRSLDELAKARDDMLTDALEALAKYDR